MKIGSVGAE